MAITSMGAGARRDAGRTSAGLTSPGFNDFPPFLVCRLWRGLFEGGALPTLEALEVDPEVLAIGSCCSASVHFNRPNCRTLLYNGIFFKVASAV